MLRVAHLSFDYPDRSLLKQINFSVPEGTLMHILGKNGSGKTTLLKLLAGILLPARGTIYFQDTPVEQHKIEYLRQICYIGHKLGISHALTLRENCYFDLHFSRNAMEWETMIMALSLTGYEDVPCGQLSSGMRRRVALLRLMMSTAKLWLLDEPFVSLDEESAHCLKQAMLKHVTTGGSIVLSSHQPLFLKYDRIDEYGL